MTQKELNQAILDELYKIAEKTIKFYMIIKDGVYTAKEISYRKDKLGNELCYIITETIEYNIQVENFKFHVDTNNVFTVIDRVERAFRIKDKRKFATSNDAKQDDTVDATCVYYKKNGNDLARRKKTLKIVAERLGLRDNELYYHAGKNWYLVHYCYSDNELDKVVTQIKENPELIKNMLQERINNNQYINTLQIELCEALGINKDDAIKARETCIAERKRKEREKAIAKAKQEEERKQKELAEKKERLESAEKDYMDGKKIASELFEELCEKYNLTLSPKQKGCLRERIVSINRGEYSFYRIRGKQDPKIDGIIKIAYKLYDLIDENINKDQFVDITDPEQIKKTLSFGADENNTDIDKFLNGDSVSFDQTDTSEERPNTFVSVESDGKCYEIDFTGKLEKPSQMEESFAELIKAKDIPEYREIVRSELYERAARYAEGYFSAYVKRSALVILCTEKLLKQLGIELNKSDSS